MSNLYKFGFTTNRQSSESQTEDQKRSNKDESKQNYEKNKRKRSFYPKWKDEFSWLEFDQEKNVMFCVPCRQHEKTGKFSEGTNNFRIDAIKSHNESSAHDKHMRNYNIQRAQSEASTSSGSIYTTYTGDIDSLTQVVNVDDDSQQPGPSSVQACALAPAVVGPMDIAIRRLNEDQIKQLSVCFNTAYFTAKEELPFTLYPKLLALQEKNGVNIPSSYQTDQACRRFMEFIDQDIQDPPKSLLREANVFSILFDGATDVSVSENEIVYARVCDQGVPRNIFVKITAVEHAHAEGVLSAIESAIDSVDPGWDWKNKLIATGSDGASVNLGRRHSVAKLLKDEVPHLFAMHCVSHRLELGALDAMRQRDGKLFADLKQVLTSLHKHYHYSAKALRELQVLADAMGESMNKPANLSGTRWMPHLQRCLDILLKKYSTFVTHFENTLEARSGTVEVQARARQILGHLKDYRLLYYMHFLKDVLKILSDLSLKFQKDSCGLPEATEALETACLRLTALHHRPGDNLNQFLGEVTQDYRFRNTQLTAPTLTQEQLSDKQNTFIDLVIDHISRRVGDVESDQLLKSMQVFYPVNLPDSDAERAIYGEESINLLCDHYSVILNRLGCDIAHLKEDEWPSLKVHMHRQPRTISVTEFYHRIFTNQNLKENFKNILMLVEIILCIPVSSAICERGFSTMSRIKSDWRSKLDINMLNILMAISIEGPSSGNYNSQRALELWWHGGQRARRPEFD